MDVRLFNRQPWNVNAPIEIRITEDMKTTKTYTMKRDEGGHGGADMRVKDLIFKPGVKDTIQGKLGAVLVLLAL